MALYGIGADARRQRRERRAGRRAERSARQRERAEHMLGPEPTAPGALNLQTPAMPGYETFMPGQAPGYGTMAEQQSMARDMYGFLSPAGINAAQREAAFGELNRGALQAAALQRGQQQAGGYGGAGSGTALALGTLGRQQLAQSRAGIEADLWEQAAGRQQEAKNLAQQMAMQRQAGIAGHQLGGYGIESQARLGAGQYALDAQRAGIDREMAMYEANQLMPYERQLSRQMAIADIAAGRRAGRQQMAGSIMGGGMSLAGSLGGAALQGGG